MELNECKKCNEHDGIEGQHVKCKHEEEKGLWGRSGGYLILKSKGHLIVKCPKE